MITPEHACQVIETYCTAETAKDRDTWLSLFAPDASHEDPVAGAGEPRPSTPSARSSTPVPDRWSRSALDRRTDRRRQRGAGVPRGARGHGRRSACPRPDRRPPGLRRRRGDRRGGGRSSTPRASCPTPHEPARRHLHPRPPRERAALAPLAHGGELGGLPARTRSRRARACSTSGAAPAPSLSTSPGGSRRVRSSAVDRAAEVLDAARARRPRRGSRQRRVRAGRRLRARPPRRVVRRRARAPGPAAPHRSGRRPARDATRVRARRRGRGARLRLRHVHVVARRPAPHAVARAVPRRGTRKRRRTRRRATSARVGARAGFTDVAATASVWCFANDEDRAWWGGMWSDRVVASAFAEQAVDGGLATRGELDELSVAWRAVASHPTHGSPSCTGRSALTA